MFRTPTTTSSRFFLICPPKLSFFGGVGGSPKNCFHWYPNIFVTWEPIKISEPYDKPFWDIFEISPFSGQNRVIWGGRGGPQKFFLIGIPIFMLLRSPGKNLKPYDKPFWGFEQRYQEINNNKKRQKKINYLK